MDISGIVSLNQLIIAISLPLICLVGDYLLTVTAIKSSHFHRAIIDNGTHGLVGLFSWASVVNLSLTPPSALVREPLLWEVVACGVLSSVLDLDHFFAARSVKLKDALSLKSRPPCHATTLIPVIGLFLFLIVKLLTLHKLNHLPVLFMVAWLSHHIRDATRRGLWMWPWGSTHPLPYWSYLTATALLPFAAILVTKTRDYSNDAAVGSRHLTSIEAVQYV